MRHLLMIFLSIFCISLYASVPSSIPGNKLIVQAPQGSSDDGALDEDEGDGSDDEDEDVIIMDDDDEVNN